MSHDRVRDRGWTARTVFLTTRNLAPSVVISATPALSYPRYSRRFSPAMRIAIASRSPLTRVIGCRHAFHRSIVARMKQRGDTSPDAL